MYIPEVMLASNFEDTKHPIEYFIENQWVIQEKSDGFRALIIKQGDEIAVAGRRSGRTKKRSFYTDSCPEITDYFSGFPESFILDCEMVSSDFNSIASKARTQKTVIHDPNFAINVFDIISWNNDDYVQQRRTHDYRFEKLKVLQELAVTNIEGSPDFFKVIPQAQKPITSQAYLDKALKLVADRGGEGLIIKNPKGMYLPGKRSKDWLKVLPYREADVMFHDMFIGEGKYSDTLGGLKAVFADEWIKGEGTALKIGTGFTDEQRHQIWEAGKKQGFFPIPGKIKYKELQASGKLRMPVFLSFNADKE